MLASKSLISPPTVFLLFYIVGFVRGRNWVIITPQFRNSKRTSKFAVTLVLLIGRHTLGFCNLQIVEGTSRVCRNHVLLALRRHTHTYGRSHGWPPPTTTYLYTKTCMRFCIIGKENAGTRPKPGCLIWIPAYLTCLLGFLGYRRGSSGLV
jgi:hypothetical protein